MVTIKLLLKSILGLIETEVQCKPVLAATLAGLFITKF